MPIGLPSTVSPVELAWTGPALLGAAFYLWLYWRARQTRLAARRRGQNGTLALMYRVRCVRHLGTLLWYTLFAEAGFASMLLPPGPDADPGDPMAWIVALCLFGAELVPLGLGLAIYHYERAINELEGARQDAEAKRREAQTRCPACEGRGYLDGAACSLS